LDEQAKPVMPHVLVVASWAKDNPVLLFISFAVVYCLAVVLNAEWEQRQKSHSGEINPPQKDASMDASLPIDVLQNAPRLLVDYVDSGQKGQLLLKTDKRVVVRKVGPLLSRDRYQIEHEFSLIPNPPFSVDVDNPVTCKIYGLRSQHSPDIRSLVDLLRGSTPESVDSVVIDYEDDHGKECSRRFDLSRAQDDSVQWIADPSVNLGGQVQTPEPRWQDLAELRHNLVLAAAFPREHEAVQQYAKELEVERGNAQSLKSILRNVRLHLPDAAERYALVRSAMRTLDSLMGALSTVGEAYKQGKEELRPLSYNALPHLDTLNRWKPHHLQLLKFQSTYLQYLRIADECGLRNPDSGNLAPPLFRSEDVYPEPLKDRFERHALALRTYAASLSMEVDNLTSSSMDHI
jgi:hypothetical protein